MNDSFCKKRSCIVSLPAATTFLALLTTVIVFCNAVQVSVSGAETELSDSTIIISEPTASCRTGGCDTLWATDARINLFEHNDPHVADGSDGSERIIAPGTSGKYLFTLKNDKPAGIIYRLDIRADNDTEYKLPVSIRLLDLSAFDTITESADIEDLSITGSGSLPPYSEHTYRLDWQWRFDGDDDYDTAIGNMAVEKDISCHIRISVTAEYDTAFSDTGYVSYSHSARYTDTGDCTAALLPIAAAVSVSAFALVFVLYRSRKKRKCFIRQP